MNKKFIKENISKYISEKIGLPGSVSKKITDDIIEIMTELISSSNLSIKNFGSFHLSKKNERLGRNPKTLETYIIPKRTVIIFKSSKQLIKKVNYLN